MHERLVVVSRQLADVRGERACVADGDVMRRIRRLRDERCVGGFVVREAGEGDGEGVQRFALTRGEDGDDAGVDAAAAEGADGDVGY